MSKSSTVTVRENPVTDVSAVKPAEVVLGQWQRILMAELDGPRAPTLRVQIWGISY